MAKQVLNPQQQMWQAMSTEYPTFQMKSGSIALTIASGENDYSPLLTSSGFPNGVLWGQLSFGAPNATWSGVVPRAQKEFFQTSGSLYGNLHYANSSSQQVVLYWTAFGY